MGGHDDEETRIIRISDVCHAVARISEMWEERTKRIRSAGVRSGGARERPFSNLPSAR